MKSCPHCGVRIEQDPPRCPLCNAPLDDGDNASHDERSVESVGPVLVTRPRLWLTEVFTLLAAVAAIVVFAADFAFGFRLSWARIPLAALAYAWIVTIAILWLRRNGPLLGTALTAGTLGLLLSLDLFIPGEAWFVPLALPLVILAVLIISAIVLTVRLRGLSVLPSIALALVGGGLYSAGLEILLHRFFEQALRVSWSIVVVACAVALALVLLLIHRRLRERHASLERVFHL
ncbi:MAG: hypothetical protein GVY29_05910 [Spirochaetes bacterium]|jgi:hypothetical protein|nr:hypothetical protein [Spirochaetota bacterium]